MKSRESMLDDQVERLNGIIDRQNTEITRLGRELAASERRRRELEKIGTEGDSARLDWLLQYIARNGVVEFSTGRYQDEFTFTLDDERMCFVDFRDLIDFHMEKETGHRETGDAHDDTA